MVAPSPDPVSVAITVASSIIAVASRFIGQGRREADELGQTQNQLGAQLDEISALLTDAEDDSLEQLATWYDQIEQLGEDYRAYTYNFPRAGPGARSTILGDDGGPGYLTKLLDYIKGRIQEKTMQLGYNWGSLIDFGKDITTQVLQRKGAIAPTPTTTRQQPPVVITTTTQRNNEGYPMLVESSAAMPAWLPYAGLALAALIVVPPLLNGRR